MSLEHRTVQESSDSLRVCSLLHRLGGEKSQRGRSCSANARDGPGPMADRHKPRRTRIIRKMSLSEYLALSHSVALKHEPFSYAALTMYFAALGACC